MNITILTILIIILLMVLFNFSCFLIKWIVSVKRYKKNKLISESKEYQSIQQQLKDIDSQIRELNDSKEMLMLLNQRTPQQQDELLKAFNEIKKLEKTKEEISDKLKTFQNTPRKR